MSLFLKKKKRALCVKHNDQELEFALLDLLRKKVTFHIQLRMGQLKQTHLLKKVRRDIARMRFFILRKNRLK